MTRKNKIGLAVAAALSIGAVAQSTQAANLAANGVGELLYIPYYSTKDGKQTFVRLVNNGFDTLAVKLKFREGTDSIDARDFHIFLSPRDVWTGRIFTDSTGEVRVHTNDTSCTVPDKARGWATGTPANPAAGTGWSINVPAVGNTASTEGYIVARVMGASKLNPFDNNADVASLVKHVNKGDGNISPRDCFSVSAAFDLNTSDFGIKNIDAYNSVRSQFTEPTNALSGAAAIVNPENSTLTDLPVTVVANVYNPGPLGADDTSGTLEAGPNDFPNDIIAIASLDFPDEAASNDFAVILDDGSASAVPLAALNTNPVSAALMHSSVMNNLDTTGANSWVVTFPTKLQHLGTPCSAPFPASCVPEITSIQHSVLNTGPVSYITNEEESEFATPEANQICFSGVDFLENCQNQINEQVFLPTEVNIVTFKGGNPLNSNLASDVPGIFLGDIVFGWMQMRFTNAVPVSGTNINTNAPTTLFGLPVIGFGYTEYNINGITTTMSQAHTFSSPLAQ